MKQKRMGRAIWIAFLLAALLTLTAMAGDVQATVPQLETPTLGQWSNAAIGWTAVDEAQYYNVVLYHAETMGGTLTRVEGITKTKNEYTVPRTAYETYQTGYFYVKVQAWTPDSTMYTSSDWVTSAPLAADSLRALETPGNVRWLQEPEDFDAESVEGTETVSLKPGTLVWDAVEGAGEYMVSLYMGQTPVAQAELLGDGYPGYRNPWMNYCDFYLDYLEPGNQYYFIVRAYPARDPYDGYPYYSELAYSATLDYQPNTQLDVPTNLHWEEKTLSWDAPAGDLDGYWVTWYHADTLHGEKTELRTERVFSSNNATIFSQETSGYYFAKVRARSADVLDVAYSDWSDFSPAYSIGDLPQLETPVNVQWVTEPRSFESVGSYSTETVMVYPGFVTWAPVSSAYSYQVTLSCDGKAVLDTSTYSNYYDLTKTICANGSGVYTVTVTAKSLGSDYQPSDPSQPVAWQYEEPTEALTAPTDLRFIQFEGSWQESAEARGYEVDWRFGATAEAIPQSISAVADRTDATAVIMPSHYLTWRGNGWYSYRVRALPADISRYCYSDWVESPAGYREEADKLTTPANFAWNGRFCNWSVPTNGTVDHYELQVYYSAASDDDLRQVDSFMSIEPQMELSRYLLEEHGEGYYAIKVKAFSADILTARDSDWSELSPVYDTLAPEAPSGLSFNGITAQWDTEAGVQAYELEWYFRSTQQQVCQKIGSGLSIDGTMTAAAISFTDLEQYGAGQYSFRIRALTDDQGHMSPWTASAEVFVDPAGDSHTAAVKDSLQRTTQAASAQQAGLIVASQIGTENLRAAMEVDGTISQTLRTLEDRLVLSTAVQSTVAEIPEALVEVTGAALNVQAGQTGTTLKIQPAQTAALPAEFEGMKTTLFSMSLTHVDEYADGHQYFRVPVQITLPLPGGYVPGQIKVFHRCAETGWQEIATAFSEENGVWYATIVVTQLSDFAFAADTEIASVVITAAGKIQVTAGKNVDLTQFICAAVYDSQRRMIAVTSTQVQSGRDVYILETDLETPPPGGEVRAFFLDDAYIPVAPYCSYIP